MKKTLVIVALVLIISTSVIAGTLSMYTITIDDLAEGSTVAKEFIFVGEGEDSFEEGVKIAPTEEVNWQFRVRNHEGSVITETDLYYRIRFHVRGTEGKEAIAPLKITVNDEEFNTTNGEGTFDVLGTFELDEEGQHEDYYVKIYWPDGDDDIDYAGRGFGTTISVSALASQAPIGEQEPQGPIEPEPGDPGEGEEPGEGDEPGEGEPSEDDDDEPEPGEPAESGILVTFKTGEAKEETSGLRYKLEMIIENNSENDIENWEIMFTLPEGELEAVWGGVKWLEDVEGLPENTYVIQHPENFNQNIPVGKKVSFTGHAFGSGTVPIQDVYVNDMPADVECHFGVLK